MSANQGDQRNWLEKLTSKIPGYSGYVDRETRRDVDKRHREQLADRLRRAKEPLTDVMRDLSNSGRLFEVGPVDSAIKKLDKLENRIRYATYGYAGFFDVVKIEQAQLDAIYRFDLALVEQADAIEGKITELKAQAGTAAGLKAAAGGVAETIDAADRAFDTRYQAINSFGQAQPPGEPPGRPMFS
jgi:hypothetical protein